MPRGARFSDGCAKNVCRSSFGKSISHHGAGFRGEFLSKIWRTICRETSASRRHGGTIGAFLNRSRTSWHYFDEGFKGFILVRGLRTLFQLQKIWHTISREIGRARHHGGSLWAPLKPVDHDGRYDTKCEDLLAI